MMLMKQWRFFLTWSLWTSIFVEYISGFVISYKSSHKIQCYNRIQKPIFVIPDVLPLISEGSLRNYSQIEDDGYSLSHKFSKKGIFSFLRRQLSSLQPPKQPGNLILVRHGESAWNHNKTFTGWVDVDLNERGRREVEHAARLLLERGFTVDIAYTSRLKRAIRSTWILLRELNQIYRPVFKSFRLNERMYGALEGLSKPEIASKLGADVVQSWRAGLLASPPAMKPDHPYWHHGERKYSDLAFDEIPVTESLQDTMERTLPLWRSRILPELRNGNNVLIVAHGNSLRGIVKHIDNLTSDEIQTVGIPNGIPLVYKFDKNMVPLTQPNAVAPLTGEFLEKKGLLRAVLEKEAEWAKNVPGYEVPQNNSKYIRPQLDPFLSGLSKLDKEKKLLLMAEAEAAAGEAADQVLQVLQDKIEDKVLLSESEPNTNADLDLKLEQAISAMTSFKSSSHYSLDTPVVVLMRHGKTEHNKLGLFTGWEDAPLAAEGVQEAIEAGRLLRRHRVEFDVVYTSWLSRAIETAWLVLDELDSVWLPIIKSWRLNERMYGALTGLSKKMIGQRHGEKQLKIWRRSYATRPPKISSFSSDYPGNDERYVKYIKDMPISLFESLIRSLAHGRIEIHRRFPKTESLRDCMERTIPYYQRVIYPESIAKGKNVLIASSENAIRGLLMHLCDIPTEVIHEIEIPTGLPLVVDYKSKCIRLLEDGSGHPDPFVKYHFGSYPELLFLPKVMRKEIVGKGTFRSIVEGASCFVTENGQIYCCDPIIRLQSQPPEENALTSNDTDTDGIVGIKKVEAVDSRRLRV